MKMNTTKFDDIIQTIMKENGVRLSMDDPIMIMQTMNEHLIARTTDAMNKAYFEHLEKLEELFHRHDIEMGEKSKRIISGMISTEKQMLKKVLSDAEDDFSKNHAALLEKVAAETKKAGTAIKTGIYIIAACSIVNIAFLFFS